MTLIALFATAGVQRKQCERARRFLHEENIPFEVVEAKVDENNQAQLAINGEAVQYPQFFLKYGNGDITHLGNLDDIKKLMPVLSGMKAPESPKRVDNKATPEGAAPSPPFTEGEQTIEGTSTKQDNDEVQLSEEPHAGIKKRTKPRKHFLTPAAQGSDKMMQTREPTLGPEAPGSPKKETPNSPKKDVPKSPKKGMPKSPKKDMPKSPKKDALMSANIEAPMSPKKEVSMSPKKNGSTYPKKLVQKSPKIESIPAKVNVPNQSANSKHRPKPTAPLLGVAIDETPMNVVRVVTAPLRQERMRGESFDDDHSSVSDSHSWADRDPRNVSKLRPAFTRGYSFDEDQPELARRNSIAEYNRKQQANSTAPQRPAYTRSVSFDDSVHSRGDSSMEHSKPKKRSSIGGISHDQLNQAPAATHECDSSKINPLTRKTFDNKTTFTIAPGPSWLYDGIEKVEKPVESFHSKGTSPPPAIAEENTVQQGTCTTTDQGKDDLLSKITFDGKTTFAIASGPSWLYA
jgi:glutaredoxin